MIAITTNSSTSVNPARLESRRLGISVSKVQGVQSFFLLRIRRRRHRHQVGIFSQRWVFLNISCQLFDASRCSGCGLISRTAPSINKCHETQNATRKWDHINSSAATLSIRHNSLQDIGQTSHKISCRADKGGFGLPKVLTACRFIVAEPELAAYSCGLLPAV